MVRYSRHCQSLALMMGLILPATVLHAAITPGGDVQPAEFAPYNSSVNIGSTGVGTLLVDSGSTLESNFANLAGGPGSSGTVTITGPGSEWINHSIFYVGDKGDGVLVIESGGQVTSNSFGYLGRLEGSTGSVTVRGTGSKWNNSREIFVGEGGQGSLVIEDGGEVSSWGGFVGGSNLPSSATIAGAGSTWTTDTTLRIGYQGNGTLTVADGGEVVTGELYASLSDLLGDGNIFASQGGILDAELVFDAAHGNQAIVTFGSGGTLTFQALGGLLGVGLKGHGSLTITEGVTISSQAGRIGYGYGSSGTATISGAGSQWLIDKTCSTCNVGGTLSIGEGLLTIESGGQVVNDKGIIDSATDTPGNVKVSGDGSYWSNSEYLYVGERGKGTLIVEAGGKVSSYHSWIAFSGGSSGTATVTGPGSRWDSTNLQIGRRGSGALTIAAGGVVTATGVLTIDSASNGDSFINMATGGMLALAGEADNSLEEFYNLIVGTDAIRYWNASLQDWAPLTSATKGTDYTLSYLAEGEMAGFTLLTVGRVGDFNNDGEVDGRDLLAWQRNPSLGSLADWQNQYNHGLLAARIAVPEPATLLLVVSLLAIGTGRLR